MKNKKLQKLKQKVINFLSKNNLTTITKLLTILLIVLISIYVICISKNTVVKKVKEVSEKYETEEIIQTDIQSIIEKEQSLGNRITIQSILQELLDNEIFENINKYEETGIIENNGQKYEVKLKYNENNEIVVNSMQLAREERIGYYLYPSTYTNEEKVEILFHVKGKIKSITKPDGLIVYPQIPSIWVDYTVTQNGTYKFIVEKEDGNIEEKQVIVDIIDTLPPKEFEITLEKTRTGFKINGSTEDEESTEISAKSGIEKYEYYIKTSSTNKWTKYETNEMIYLSEGTYEAYAVAYDKAGNKSNESNIETIKIEGAVEIWNEEELRDIDKNLSRDYVLMADIETTGEWKALGNSKTPFRGKLEGNGYSISKIYIEKPTENRQGLFGEISSTAKISNLKLDCNIVGKEYVGGVAGQCKGIIENVDVKGRIKGEFCVGAIVGDNGGSILKTYSEATVIGEKNDIGGIAGASSRGLIKYAHSVGEIIGNNNVGGIVGYLSEGNVEEAYSAGKVIGNNSVGGIVGNILRGNIKNTYSLAKMKGNNNVEGLIGYNDGNWSSAINSYWSQEISEIERMWSGPDKYGGKIVTPEQLNDEETYENWDFENIWVMREYPELR